MIEKLFQISGHLRVVAHSAEACDELAQQSLARINLIEPCAHLEIESSREEISHGGQVVSALMNAVGK